MFASSSRAALRFHRGLSPVWLEMTRTSAIRGISRRAAARATAAPSMASAMAAGARCAVSVRRWSVPAQVETVAMGAV